MHKLIVLFTTAVFALSLTGCWSSSPENTGAANEAVDREFDTNANLRVATNIDVNIVNDPPVNAVNTNESPLLEIQSNKVGNHVRRGMSENEPDNMKKVENMRQFKLAPEGSLISNEMNKEGNPVQTRKFGGNPVLDKVEVITVIGKNEIKQLVYLKNGKVLPLANGKIANPMTASSYDLLTAVGVETPSAPPMTAKEKEKQN